MNPEPTPGEYKILKYLKDELPDDCKVFFQAKLDYKLPDVVVMRRGYGVVLIEVKDYTLESYRARDVDTWEVNTDAGWKKIRSPIKQVKEYKDTFFKIYSRELRSALMFEGGVFGIVKAVVYFSGSSNSDVAEILNKKSLKNEYVEMITDDDLKNGYFLETLQKGFNILGKKSKFFSDEIYESLNRVLSQSKHSKLKYSLKDMVFTSEQKKYCKSKSNTKRKIRGIAGSGKTTVMAKRAVDAFVKTNSQVLILTFNITLGHYIEDCISVFRKKDVGRNNFIVTHYHGFVLDYKNKHGIVDTYTNTDEEKYIIEAEDISERFKTIYVDEIQDYKKEWVDTIHRLLDDGGELVFWGDEGQNIYQRSLILDSENKRRVYTRIGGAWGKLSTSHRCTGKIANLARLFQIKYLSQYDDNIFTYQDEMFDNPASITYMYKPSVGPDIEKQIVNIFVAIINEKKIHYDDVCILSGRVSLLRGVEKELRCRGYCTEPTFESQEDYLKLKECCDEEIKNISKNLALDPKIRQNKIKQCKKELQYDLETLRRTAKFCFWMESGKVKLSTIHSYKGWGIDTEILIIASDDSEEENPDSDNDNKKLLQQPIKDSNNNELMYTALTRAKSNLCIINLGHKMYDEFFTSQDVRELIEQ